MRSLQWNEIAIMVCWNNSCNDRKRVHRCIFNKLHIQSNLY